MATTSVRKGSRRPTVAYFLCGVFVAPLLRLFNRIRVYDAERLPVGEGFVLAPNHLSIVDPWPLSYPFFPRQLRFMAKADLFRFPMRSALRTLGAFPVRRGRGDIDALENAADIVRAGEIVLVFPEGTRLGKTDWTKLRDPFHRGAALVALQADAPLVPMAIMGTDRLFRFGRIRILCAPPVEIDDLRELPRREGAVIATQRLRTALEELLASLQVGEQKR